jgi:undecaprenyl-diphosphatase
MQGATEFLPVSSSGHLVLLRQLWGLRPPGATVEAALHLGTVGAVLVAYAQPLARLVYQLVGPAKRPHAWRALGALILGSVPAALVGWWGLQVWETAFASARAAAWGLLATSLLLASLPLAPPAQGAQEIQDVPAPPLWTALGVGFAQAMALLPGLSRSGATMVAGRWLGLAPQEAAAFSFLLSVPASLGAAAVELLGHGTHLPAPDRPLLALAALVAGGTGYGCLRLTARWLQAGRLTYFALYTGALGMATLLWAGRP